MSGPWRTIRFQVSLLLLLSTLNAVAAASLSTALFSSLAGGPSARDLVVARTVEIKLGALDAELAGAASPEDLPDVDAAMDRLGADLEAFSTETGAARAELRAYARAAVPWAEHVRSGLHAPTPEGEDAVGQESRVDLRRAHGRAEAALRNMVYHPRPAWVDELKPILPWAVTWVIGFSSVVVVLAWGLQRVLAAPLRRLVEAAEAISHGNLSVDVPVPRGAPTEIAAVAQSMKSARDRLVQTIAVHDERTRQTAAMLAQLTDGVVLTDGMLRVLETNDAADRLLQLLAIDGKVGALLPDMVPELAGDRITYANDLVVEVVRTAGGARRRWVEARMRKVPRSNDRDDAWVVVLRDVSDAKEIEQIKRDFLSVITHELKTPLTAIEGYSRLMTLGKGGEMTAKQLEWARTIHDQAAILKHMVQNLLDTTRLEGGNLSMDLAEHDVAEFVRRSADTWRVTAESAGVKFAVDLPVDGSIVARMDDFRMQQVLGNLVSNALKFTPAGGELTLGASREARHAVITVSDTGRGIPAEALPSIFDKFFQVERGDTRKAGGAGLGLYIVRQLVEAQGGTVDVHSALGAGTHFEIRLPLTGVPDGR
jgi:signal transduction histidine kinase